MGVGAVLMSVVTSLAVKTVFVYWAIPDSVSGLELLTEVAPMREREGLDGVTSLHIFVMKLWHDIPP